MYLTRTLIQSVKTSEGQKWAWCSESCPLCSETLYPQQSLEAPRKGMKPSDLFSVQSPGALLYRSGNQGLGGRVCAEPPQQRSRHGLPPTVTPQPLQPHFGACTLGIHSHQLLQPAARTFPASCLNPDASHISGLTASKTQPPPCNRPFVSRWRS